MRERARLLIVGVLIFVMLLGVYMLLVRPRSNELATLRTQIEAERANGSALQVELARLESLRDNSAELEADLAAIRELVPRRHEVENMIFLIQKAADESGVDFVEIRPELPKQPPEGAALAEVRFSIQAGGGFFSVQDFMRRLYDLDRALRIDLLGLLGAEAPDGSGTTITLNLTARVFFELPAGGAVTTTPTTTAPTTPTVGNPSPDPAATPGTEATPGTSTETNAAT